MLQYIIVFGIAFAVFGFLILVFVARDPSGKKGSPSGCCGGTKEKTSCGHCSKPIRTSIEGEPMTTGSDFRKGNEGRTGSAGNRSKAERPHRNGSEQENQ